MRLPRKKKMVPDTIADGLHPKTWDSPFPRRAQRSADSGVVSAVLTVESFRQIRQRETHATRGQVGDRPF
jgi:hypothetical protein